ncbi:MAG: hypothetical protein E7448_00855 [Ruminococcaceae bacterium]|nr:hypothetical protein [Oscillospiraceae bacterium]
MASVTKVKPKFRLHIPKVYAYFTVIWLVGLVLGTVFAAGSGNQYFLMMHTATGHRVTIVGLTATVLLPFLLTAFAVYKNRRWLLYSICFAKAFAFAYCGLGIAAAYGSASWLVRPLFQFSDIVTVPILVWFALRNLNGMNTRRRQDFGICLGFDIVVCCLDLWYISPFLAFITKN